MESTFKQVALLWLDAKRKTVKHSTYCAYLLTVNVHLLPRFGAQKSVKEADVQQFAFDQLTSGHARKTVRDTVAVLKQIVKFGSKRNLFPYDVWEVVYPTETSDRRIPMLTLPQQRTLMVYLLEHVSPRSIGVLLALQTGMRIGEVCALKWDDVDFGQRIINICRTSGSVYNIERRAVENLESVPKTRNSYREIPISAPLYRALRQVRKQTGSTYVTGGMTHPVSTRNYRDYYNRLMKRLGLPHVVFHGLRHTFASRCIESRCDVKTVSALLGHSNVATTLNLYVHPTLGQKKRAVEQMNKMLKI